MFREKGKELPSPDTLKGKIIIKNKRRKEDQVGFVDSNQDNDGDTSTKVTAQGEEIIMETDEEKEARKARTKEIHPDLSAMVNYVWFVTFVV